MSSLTDRLIRWGPCIWLTTCGGLVDLWTGLWGPGLVVGALIGVASGRMRWAAERRDRDLQARAGDGLNGLYEPGPFEDWELEDNEVHPLKRSDD